MPSALYLAGGNPGYEMTLPTRAREDTTQQVIVWLIDGFGYHQVEEALRRQLMPTLERLLSTRRGHLESMMTVFPSMTPVALASLMTGSFPEQHGVVGHIIEVGGQSVDVIREPLPGSLVLESGSIAERARQAGIPYRVVIENRLRNGPLTNLLHRDADQIDTFVVASGLPVVVKRALDQQQTGLIYVYWSGPDSINHQRGAYGAEWVAEMRWLDHCLEEIVSQTRPGAWLWITADHGHIPMQGTLSYAEFRHQFPDLPELPTMVGPGIAVEVENLSAVQEFLMAWAPVPIEVMNVRELMKAGYFGPGLDTRYATRLGPQVLMPPSGWYWKLKPDKALQWSHGGKSLDEMTIPWIEIDLGGRM